MSNITQKLLSSSTPGANSGHTYRSVISFKIQTQIMTHQDASSPIRGQFTWGGFDCLVAADIAGGVELLL